MQHDSRANQPIVMFSRLLFLFVVVPAIELFLLIRIGQWIGAAETFMLILVTGLIGSAMAKAEGLAVWGRFNRRVAEGKVPGKELADGIIILVSGAFLITPGVLTDVVGLLGLFPPTRALIRRVLMERLGRKGISGAQGMFFTFGAGGEAGTQGAARSQQAGEPADTESARSDSAAQVSGRARTRPAYDSETADSGSS